MKHWSKTTRICVMMVLDTVFLFIELGVGYYVSSLALIADAFHMLNDIISLAVGLWAVMLARKESNDTYSYGWLRAEILGAFFNATFLIGLCVTIVLEAIQRFFDPPEIISPKLVLIVGCFGLLSNIAGFFVLGGHGHSHGPGGEEGDLEAGHVHDHDHGHNHSHSHDEHAVHGDEYEDDPEHCHDEEEDELEEAAAAAVSESAGLVHKRASSPDNYRRIVFGGGVERSASRGSARSRGAAGLRARANSSRRVPTSIDDISIHPASFRQDIQEIIAASRTRNVEDEDEGDSDDTTTIEGENTPAEGGATPKPAVTATERTPLIIKSQSNGPANSDSPKIGQRRHISLDGAEVHHHDHNSSHSHTRRPRRDSHGGHHHNEPRDPAKHGHSHGDMGMNAMILHVMGDALGNIGVIVTALIIWKTTWQYRMYADPVVSLVITAIILHTALPLTKATSKILLQATPDHISIKDIREDIEDLDGVLSCHHIHVWQLSDTQIVASMHVEMTIPISEYGGEKYMKLAKRVRKCLHAYGIHSATIQPEFRLDDDSAAAAASGRGRHALGGAAASALGAAGRSSTATTASTAVATANSPQGPSCLLDCVDNCVGQGCCSMGSRTGSPPDSSHSGHSHGHGYDQDHNHGHGHSHGH